MKRIVNLLFVLFLVVGFFLSGVVASAQTTPPATQTWSLNTSAVSLPNGKQTVAGVDSGITFTVTQNFDLIERNLLATGSTFQYYAGGFNYRLPVLSTKLNNMSPNLNGYRFQFFLTGSVGSDRISTATDTKQHIGFTGGGGVNYDITQSGSFTFGGSVEYAKFPGYANNTWIVKVGPQFHF